MSEQYFKLGQYVKVSKDITNEYYDNFRNKKLKIIHVATNTDEHPGYDDAMEHMPLYDLQNVETGEIIDSSLYFYELEAWV